MTARNPLEIAADGYGALTHHLAGEILDLSDADRVLRVLAIRHTVDSRHSRADADAVVDDIARQWIERRRRSRMPLAEGALEHAHEAYAAWLAPFAPQDIRRHGRHLRSTAGDDLADRVAEALKPPEQIASDQARSASTAARDAAMGQISRRAS